MQFYVPALTTDASGREAQRATPVLARVHAGSRQAPFTSTSPARTLTRFPRA